MKRPLLAAALCVVLIAAVRLEMGMTARIPPGCVSTKELDSGENLTVIGQVYQKEEQSIYLTSISIMLSDSNFYPLNEKLICQTERAFEIPLGSRVTLEGEYMPYAQATNPGEFDAAVYYRTLGIGGRLKKTVILAMEDGGWPLREGLYRFKSLLKERLYYVFPEKEAAVMSALLLGEKKELDEELKELYKRNGILHIFSISSLHITIIGMGVYQLLRKGGIPICPAAAAGSVILILYGCMTGFSISACRAIGMYLIRMLAEMTGRTYDMLTALGVMAAVMVIRNPYYLQSGGFLLSFASVLGIGVVFPALAPEKTYRAADENAEGKENRGENRGRNKGSQDSRREICGIWKILRVRKNCQMEKRKQIQDGSPAFRKKVEIERKLKEKMRRKKKQSLKARLRESLCQSFSASLSITLTTLPVQLWLYYEIPMYSIFLNLLVIPLLKPMMTAGILTLAPGLACLSGIDSFILKSYEFLCGSFNRLPFHTWNPGRPAVWQMVLYYLLLSGVTAAGYVRRRKGKDGDNRKGNAVVISIAVLGLAVLLLGVRPAGADSVTFLDVGQGDCILVRTASGQTYLFDCGSSSRSSVGKYVLIPYLKYNGIHAIDAVFLSHPDADHVNGALELFEPGGENGIKVKQIFLPAIEASAREEAFVELYQAVSEASYAQGREIPVGYLSAGEMWDSGSAVFTCLHPNEGYNSENANAYSECFYVEFKGDARTEWTLLLTGDVEGRGEEALLKELKARGIQGITVLKAAHHGSRNSSSEALLSQVNPSLAVISCGRNNRYGHPHRELLERLEQIDTYVMQTAESGAVTVAFRKGSIQAFAVVKQKE